MTSARDWKFQVDLKTRLKIPDHISSTSLRPDMILVSEVTKHIGIIELTVPTEERIEISTEIKKAKYAIIEEEAKRNGWIARVWAVEVGCRGFPAASMARFLSDIGFKGRKKKDILQKIGREAEVASEHLWKTVHYKTWGEK